MAAVVCGAATCMLLLVSYPKERKRGCRRLVTIRGRDGAAAPPFAKCFAHKEIMMGGDEYASRASCVMTVMTVNCGGDDSVLLMMVM